MWYKEEFKVMALPLTHQGSVDQQTLETMLNELGKQGWDIEWPSIADGFVVMNRQRQISTQERVDRVVEALKLRGMTIINIQINMPNPLSDDGRVTSLDHGALREIVRLVLEES